MTLVEAVKEIKEPDRKAMEEAKIRWDHVAKPLGSLGLLEDAVTRIAGIQGSARICLKQKAVVIFCGDNGIVEEGVTQTGQEVTAVVAENFSRGLSCVCIMAEQAGAGVIPVDMGVCRELSCYGDLPVDASSEIMGQNQSPSAQSPIVQDTTVKYPVINCRIMDGTRNFLKGTAMDRQQALAAVEAGIRLVEQLKERGYHILATGEMGIGNTTTSSAVIAAILGKDPAEVTGRGAGLDSAGLKRKISVIRQGLALHQPNPADGLDVLSKVGGLDLAGMTGAFIGGALYHIPVVIDGLISAAAALLASVICPSSVGYMLGSHVSAEPAHQMVLDHLGLEPVIRGRMCLGEGTGAVALFPLLDMAAAVYERMGTFQDIQIEEYHHLT